MFVFAVGALIGATVSSAPTEAASATYTRSEHRYEVPDAVLTNHKGKSFSLAQELSANGPVLVNFISTGCESECEIVSVAIADARKTLGREARKMRFISIAMDPRVDTVARLRAYAGRYQLEDNWMMVRGRGAEIEPVLRAFDNVGKAEKGSAVIYLRATPGGSWIRLGGALTGADLITEYQKLNSH